MDISREHLAAFEPPRPWSWPSSLLVAVAVSLAFVLAFIAVARHGHRPEKAPSGVAQRMSAQAQAAADRVGAER